MVESAKRKAEHIVQEFDKKGAAHGIKVHNVVKSGEPRATITAYVHEANADALIMGSRGAGVNKVIFVARCLLTVLIIAVVPWSLQRPRKALKVLKD